jgi:hypothetical protein
MRHYRALIFVPAAALVLAACGISSPPPWASALAAKIPGCSYSALSGQAPNVLSTGEHYCNLRDGATVEIATFASTAKEQKWILDGGSPSSPDPAFAGCCIQGDGWAATVDSNFGMGATDQYYVIKAIGGRMVSR